VIPEHVQAVFAAVVEHRVAPARQRPGRGARGCSRPFRSLERASLDASAAGSDHAAITRLGRAPARRDSLPITINRRRIYILPTRFGLMLARCSRHADRRPQLQQQSRPGVRFLMVSLALVAMHHCHRNLLGLSVDVNPEVDAFAGADAVSISCCATNRPSSAATSKFAAATAAASQKRERAA
jgi:hypothetical protein